MALDHSSNKVVPPAGTGKSHVLRTWVASTALAVLLFYILYLLGVLDPLAKDRVRDLAQLELEASAGNRWYGTRCWQFPEDLLLYQEVLFETRPDAVIELGSEAGGLSLYLSTLLEFISPDAPLVCVDMKIKPLQETLEKLDIPGKEQLRKRIKTVEGFTTDADVVARVKELVKDRKNVLVIFDAAHDRAGVLKELEIYSPLVPVNGYALVNDTHLERYARFGGPEKSGGANAAVKAFLASNPNFVPDRQRDKFAIGCAHGGFLKRVR